jgi:hypothetical protein
MSHITIKERPEEPKINLTTIQAFGIVDEIIKHVVNGEGDFEKLYRKAYNMTQCLEKNHIAIRDFVLYRIGQQVAENQSKLKDVFTFLIIIANQMEPQVVNQN